MSSANGWETYGDWLETQQREVVAWLVRGIRPGMTVLDVATGTGIPALEIARRVGPGGRVIGTDAAADMLAGCERRARGAGISNLELRELDMHELRGIADASVDAVTLAFALMFSPSPSKVTSEVRRVLRPGGSVAVAVWDQPSTCPYFTSLFGALMRVFPTSAPPPGAPGPFALSAPGALESALRAGGFDEATAQSIPFEFTFESVDEHWEITRALAAPLKRAAETASPEKLAQLREAIAEAIAPFQTGARVEIKNTALCAVARKA